MNQPFHHRGGELHCEGVAASALAARFGTPLYVYSAAAITGRFRMLEEALAPVSPLIAYSVKANGNLAVLRLLAELGAGADIVSGGELHRARLAGIPADRIVFSGVGKTTAEMEAALDLGILAFNVESEGELRVLAEVAAHRGERAAVALRVNPDVEPVTPHHYTRTGHATTKFGVPYDDAPRLYRLAASLPGLEVVGVDVHIGSQILETDPYGIALRRILGLVEALREDGIELTHLDLGGGLGVSYGDAPGPTAGQFAGAVLPLLEASRLRVVIEPGRFIVGPAGLLLTRVLYIKEMGGKTFVVADAGMNDLLRPSHYASFHRIQPVAEREREEKIRADVVGPVCESGDFLGLDRTLPRLQPGDLLAVETAGAYGFSMASTYNSRPRPAEVLVSGATASLVRRRETYQDLVRGEAEFLDDSTTGAR